MEVFQIVTIHDFFKISIIPQGNVSFFIALQALIFRTNEIRRNTTSGSSNTALQPLPRQVTTEILKFKEPGIDSKQ